MTEFLRCRKCGKILCASDTPLLMTSIDVAQMLLKRHSDVMRDIKIVGVRNFAQSTYKNSQGQTMPCFTVNWDGLRILSRRYRVPVKIQLEIKNSKRVVRIFGAEKVEFTCDRCGEVSGF